MSGVLPSCGRAPGGCPTLELNGKPFRNYTEELSGYASGGIAVEMAEKVGNAAQAEQAGSAGQSGAPRRIRADAQRNVDALLKSAKDS
jgi:hypothetical protein